MLRKNIDERYKWDLTPLCENDEEFYQKLKVFKAFLPKLKAYEGKLNNKKDIFDFLKLEEKADKVLSKISQYCFLKTSEDLANEKYNEMSERLELATSQFSVDTSFALSELLELDDKFIDEIIADKKFEEYNRLFESVKKDKKHKLSKSEEKLLAGMDFLGSQSEVMSKMADVDFDYGFVFDSKGKKYKLTQSNYGKFMRSADRKLREGAFKALNGKYGEFASTLSSNYISHVKEDCYFAKIRNYKSAIARALEDEEIDEKVYNSLIKHVSDNLNVIFEYYDLKRKQLGLKNLYIYDNLASGEKVQQKFTYQQAFDLIKKALSPLGEDYIALLDKAYNERWIDVYPNENKQSGAYESGIYDAHPYVLTNFEGDLDSVFTLAHELGHALHTCYTNKAQPRAKSSYPIFLAEIASITNEILLLNYLLNNATKKQEKISLYNKLFDEIKSTIFRQTMFAEFEEKVHAMQEAGEGLTKDKLCNTYYQLNQKYFGKVKLTQEVKYEWARIPHFFTSFYVYKYATGMISAICFASKLLSSESEAKEGYFKFLSAGCSKKPIEILKISGCNYEDGSAFQYAFDYMKNMLKEWKKLAR